MAMTVGDKIKALRNEKRFTLDQLAQLAGCSKSYVWELENRNPPRPSAEKLSGIAKALGVTLEYFMDEEVTEENAADQMFYREYQRKDPKTKEKIRQLLKLLDE